MPGLTVIVPATDRPAALPRCLAAVRAAAEAPDEVIVVEEPAHSGPAQARNVGAARAADDVLCFVDADVEVHPDAFARLRAAFARDPGLTTAFGAYDDHPSAPGAVSGFRNLLHHHVHVAGAGPAHTFWAGLGASAARPSSPPGASTQPASRARPSRTSTSGCGWPPAAAGSCSTPRSRAPT